MYTPSSYLLWEDDKLSIVTPVNPHIPYSEGLHIVVAPKVELATAWEDIDFSTKAFKLASKACAIMDDLKLAPWFNIQANGNWGLLPGGKPFFHIHVYDRNKTQSWGKPIVLPAAPKTYQNDPMPEKDRDLLNKTFKSSLSY